MARVLTNEEKIDKIKSERKELLELARNSINNNKELLASEINQLVAVLKADEKATKQYEAILKAKDLIEDLIEDIINANSIEDIIAIRKRLNYYINKVKKELLSRGIDESEIEKYQDLVGNVRKDVSKYIRFLKRDANIDEINKIYACGDLTNEEKKQLRTLISKEEKYNRSQLSSNIKTNNTKKTIDNQKIIVEEKNATIPVISTLTLEGITCESVGCNEEASSISDIDKLISETRALIGSPDTLRETVDEIIAELRVPEEMEKPLVTWAVLDSQKSVSLEESNPNNQTDRIIAEVRGLIGSPDPSKQTVDEIITELKVSEVIEEPVVENLVSATPLVGKIEGSEDDSRSLSTKALVEVLKGVIDPKEIKEPIVEKTVTSDNISEDGVYKDDIAFLKDKVHKYSRRYRIRRAYQYKGNITGDVIKLFKNIPIYRYNRKRVKRMMIDTKFYSGGDFMGYIDYVERKSSIKYALKMIFNKKYFNSLEAECLNNHEECVKWVFDYCNRSEYRYLFPQKVKAI